MNKTYISLLLLLSSLSAYPQTSDPVESALAQSGANRKSLESLLKHYEKRDKEKLEAVRFLIANMPYKSQPYTITKQPSRLHDLVLRADSTYYGLVRGFSDAQLDVEPFNIQVLSKTDQAYRKMMEAQHFEEPAVEYGEYTDISHSRQTCFGGRWSMPSSCAAPARLSNVFRSRIFWNTSFPTVR